MSFSIVRSEAEPFDECGHYAQSVEVTVLVDRLLDYGSDRSERQECRLVGFIFHLLNCSADRGSAIPIHDVHEHTKRASS
jgi:hypothetical protein